MVGNSATLRPAPGNSETTSPARPRKPRGRRGLDWDRVGQLVQLAVEGVGVASVLSGAVRTRQPEDGPPGVWDTLAEVRSALREAPGRDQVIERWRAAAQLVEVEARLRGNETRNALVREVRQAQEHRERELAWRQRQVRETHQVTWGAANRRVEAAQRRLDHALGRLKALHRRDALQHVVERLNGDREYQAGMEWLAHELPRRGVR